MGACEPSRWHHEAGRLRKGDPASQKRQGVSMPVLMPIRRTALYNRFFHSVEEIEGRFVETGAVQCRVDAERLGKAPGAAAQQTGIADGAALAHRHRRH